MRMILTAVVFSLLFVFSSNLFAEDISSLKEQTIELYEKVLDLTNKKIEFYKKAEASQEQQQRKLYVNINAMETSEQKTLLLKIYKTNEHELSFYRLMLTVWKSIGEYFSIFKTKDLVYFVFIVSKYSFATCDDLSFSSDVKSLVNGKFMGTSIEKNVASVYLDFANHLCLENKYWSLHNVTVGEAVNRATKSRGDHITEDEYISKDDLTYLNAKYDSEKFLDANDTFFSMYQKEVNKHNDILDNAKTTQSFTGNKIEEVNYIKICTSFEKSISKCACRYKELGKIFSDSELHDFVKKLMSGSLSEKDKAVHDGIIGRCSK